MTTYTTILDANLDPDSPARSIDALALRDNATAVSENDPTAPQPLCLVGDAYTCWEDGGTSGVTGSTTYAADTTVASQLRHIVKVYATGTIRVKLSHRTNDATYTSFARVRKNGSTEVEWSTTSITFVSRSVDISVTSGDVVEFSQRISNVATSTQWEDLKLTADRQVLTSGYLGL